MTAASQAGLPQTTVDLVSLRASQINGCAVCLDMHTRGAKKAGETDERLFTVAAWRDAPYFTDAERAALALAEAGTRLADRADPVPDAVFDEAAKHYDEQALAALIVCIAVHQHLEPAQCHHGSGSRGMDGTVGQLSFDD